MRKIKRQNIDIQFRNYRSYKRYLLEDFQGRCAYCETKITPSNFGDVEHFRPKGKVDEDPIHHGYYWLACEYSNLLLSCSKCNTGAKLTSFPIEGIRAYNPTDNLDNEKPLLLNPCDDNYDPFIHFDFCPKNFDEGKWEVIGKTKKGVKTIDTYQLNRKDLKESRNLEQLKFNASLKLKIIVIISSDNNSEFDNFDREIERLVNIWDHYSTACISSGKFLKNKLINLF